MLDARPLARRDGYRVRGSSRLALVGVTIGFFVGFASVALYGTTALTFASALQLSPTRLGLFVAVPTLSGALLRIPFGAWTDKVGGRIPMVTLLGVSLVGLIGITTLLLATPPGGLGPSDLVPLLLLGALAGTGVATFSVGVNQISYWTPKRNQGRALGIFGGLGNLAPGVFTLLVPLASARVGLTGAYLVWLAVLGAGAVTYIALARGSPWFQLRRAGFSPGEARERAELAGQEIFPTGDTRTSLRISAGNPRTWALVVLYFASFGSFAGLTAWLPTFWASFGWMAATASLAAAFGFALLSPLVRVEGGLFSDWWAGENVALVGFGLLAAGAALVLGRFGGIATLAGVGVIAIGAGLGCAAVFKLVPRYVPGAVGGAAGWVGGIGGVGGFVVPLVLGATVEATGPTGFVLGFLIFPVLSAVAIGVTIWLRRTSHEFGADLTDPRRGISAIGH